MIEETPKELPGLFQYLWALIKNPVQEIKKLPQIQWTTLIVFQFCLTLASALFSNLLSSLSLSLTYVMLSLAVAVVATGLVSLFFYYFFLILYNQALPFKSVFTLVLFAHIPFAIFHLASHFFPPADLIGLGISALLMIVGLVENFAVPRRLAMQLMIGLYSVFFIYWSVQLFTARQNAVLRVPQELDQIEQEVNKLFDN